MTRFKTARTASWCLWINPMDNQWLWVRQNKLASPKWNEQNSQRHKNLVSPNNINKNWEVQNSCNVSRSLWKCMCSSIDRSIIPYATPLQFRRPAKFVSLKIKSWCGIVYDMQHTSPGAMVLSICLLKGSCVMMMGVVYCFTCHNMEPSSCLYSEPPFVEVIFCHERRHCVHRRL